MRSERRPELGAAIDGVLARAMAKEPDGRQSTCGDLVDEAREALGLVRPDPGRRRIALAAIGGAALVAVAVAAVVLATGGGAPAPPSRGDRSSASTPRRIA